MMLFRVFSRPTTVACTMRSERFLPCSCCTFLATGMVKAIHHRAVTTKDIFMPSMAEMPKLGPPSTTTRQTMKGMQEPM